MNTSMNEKTINIKAKIMEQAHRLVQSVDDAFIAGTSAHEVEEDLFKQLLHRRHQAITLLLPIMGGVMSGKPSSWKIKVNSNACLSRMEGSICPYLARSK